MTIKNILPEYIIRTRSNRIFEFNFESGAKRTNQNQFHCLSNAHQFLTLLQLFRVEFSFRARLPIAHRHLTIELVELNNRKRNMKFVYFE